MKQRGEQLRLFVGQCVTGAVEDRERRARVVVEQVESRGVPDSRVLLAGRVSARRMPGP